MNKISLYTYLTEILGEALLQTLYMIIVPTIVATILGFIMAVILVVTKPKGLKPNKTVYSILGFIVNMVRSFPFIILLLIALIPFYKIYCWNVYWGNGSHSSYYHRCGAIYCKSN